MAFRFNIYGRILNYSFSGLVFKVKPKMLNANPIGKIIPAIKLILLESENSKINKVEVNIKTNPLYIICFSFYYKL